MATNDDRAKTNPIELTRADELPRADDTQTSDPGQTKADQTQLGQTNADGDSPDELEFEVGTPTTIGKYELQRLLGQGGVGSVYLAFDPLIQRHVAIKILNSSLSSNDAAVKRFLSEAQAVGRLNHPNVLAIYDVGHENHSYYIVTELVEGGSVRDLLDEAGTLSLADACRIAIAAARGVEAAHQAGFVHRDIKPENLMLTKDGDVKVVDFGLAKELNPETTFSLTQTGHIVGTPYYMSPEQITGEPVDLRTDIYSLGATFFQLITGDRPFPADSMANLVYAHVHAERPDPAALNPHLPDECTEIIARSMAVEPERRYESMSQFIEAVKAAMSQHAAATQSIPVPAAPKREHPPSILVLDASALAGKIIADRCRHAGCTDVYAAKTVDEAQQHATALSFDVVVSARQLRDTTGDAALNSLGAMQRVAKPMLILTCSDSPLQLMQSSSGLDAWARKQSPDEILKAIYCATDHALPSFVTGMRDLGALRVRVATEDGVFPQRLREMLLQLGVSDAVHETPESGPAATGDADLTIHVDAQPADDDELPHRLASIAEQTDGPSTIALVSDVDGELTLQAVLDEDYVAAASLPFDVERLERILKIC